MILGNFFRKMHDTVLTVVKHGLTCTESGTLCYSYSVSLVCYGGMPIPLPGPDILNAKQLAELVAYAAARGSCNIIEFG